MLFDLNNNGHLALTSMLKNNFNVLVFGLNICHNNCSPPRKLRVPKNLATARDLSDFIPPLLSVRILFHFQCGWCHWQRHGICRKRRKFALDSSIGHSHFRNTKIYSFFLTLFVSIVKCNDMFFQVADFKVVSHVI